MVNKKPVKGIGLVSGGLDSVLAVKLLQMQGIEVIGLSIKTGFSSTDFKKEIKAPGYKDLKFNTGDISEKLACEMRVADISDDYFDMVLNPKHGYGKNVNPCIDCRIMMLSAAKKVMVEEGADFVFTGEVVAQRPMSQHRPTLAVTEAAAGLQGRLLRPLSALLLEPTLPELEGKVDREKLLDISGRSRTRQLALAEEWGVGEVAVPAGGNCYLINPDYATRMFDLYKYNEKTDLSREMVKLINTGRHFRIHDRAKLIVSRDLIEHIFLEKYAKNRYYFELTDGIGSMALGEGEFSEDDIILSARITARYSKEKDKSSVKMTVRYNETEQIIEVEPFSVNDPIFKKMII